MADNRGARDMSKELAEQLIALAAKATPGPWEADTTENEGEYGSGPNTHSGFKSPVMLDPSGEVLFDAINGDLIEVNEEYDENGCYAWDEPGRCNFALIAALRNNLPAIIAALRATEPAQVADADREATVDDINWPDDDGGERYLPESEVERLVAQGRAEAEREVVVWLRNFADILESDGTAHVNKAQGAAIRERAEADATELREEIARLRALLENVTDRLEWLVAACQPDEAGPTFRPDSYFVRMARGSVEHVRAALGENTDG